MEINELKADRIKNQEGYRFTSLMELKEKVKKDSRELLLDFGIGEQRCGAPNDVIKVLNEDDNPKVFLLWGAKAWEKEKFITNPNHLVLKSPHPSPLSSYRGFFGCKHFSKCNEFLVSKGLTPINWDNN